jgi:hypothetical protein
MEAAMKSILMFAAVVWMSRSAQADEIHLSSGKVLHGTLVPEGDHFVVHLDDGGAVTVRKDDVLILGVPPSPDARPHPSRRGRRGHHGRGRQNHSLSGVHDSRTLSISLN